MKSPSPKLNFSLNLDFYTALFLKCSDSRNAIELLTDYSAILIFTANTTDYFGTASYPITYSFLAYTALLQSQ